jgi:hypothetical protein
MSDLLDDDICLDIGAKDRLAQLQERCDELEAENIYLKQIIQLIYDRVQIIARSTQPFFDFAEKKHGMFYNGPNYDNSIIEAIKATGVVHKSSQELEDAWQGEYDEPLRAKIEKLRAPQTYPDPKDLSPKSMINPKDPYPKPIVKLRKA